MSDGENAIFGPLPDAGDDALQTNQSSFATTPAVLAADIDVDIPLRRHSLRALSSCHILALILVFLFFIRFRYF